jgi:hypothetical protein
MESQSVAAGLAPQRVESLQAELRVEKERSKAVKEASARVAEAMKKQAAAVQRVQVRIQGNIYV